VLKAMADAPWVLTVRTTRTERAPEEVSAGDGDHARDHSLRTEVAALRGGAACCCRPGAAFDVMRHGDVPPSSRRLDA
jgi:hypothetical protein